MTVTPRRRAMRSAPLPRPAAMFLAAAALVAAVVVVGPGAASGTATPQPSPTTPSGVAALVLSPLSSGVVRPGESLAVSVTLDNDTSSEHPGGSVDLSIGAAALSDRQSLTAWLDGASTIDGMLPIGVGTIDALAPEASRTTGIVVPATEPGLAERGPGVYPLAAVLTDGETDAEADVAASPLTARSVLIVPDDASTSQVAVIVPVTTAPRSAGLLTAVELAALTRAGGALTSVLDAVDGTSAILAIDPAIAASIRVLGSSAPLTALAWLDRLESLANDRFALQFGDADVSAQLAAGRERPMQPTSLQYAMNPVDFVPTPSKSSSPTASPAPSPSASVDPTAPVFPVLEDLVAIDGARDTVFWPEPDGTTPDVLATLGGLGDDEAAALTVLPSTRLTAGANGATVTARTVVDGSDVLVTDAAISAALHEASLIDDSARRGAKLAAATAHLTFAAADAAGSPLLVTLGRDADRSIVALGSTLLAVAQAPGAAPATLDDLRAEPARLSGLAETSGAPERAGAASTLFADEEALARFATVLDEPRQLTAPEQTAILQLLGVAWAAEPADWTTALAEHRDATQETLDSVGLLTVPDVQQIGPSADIPVWVRNDLPYDANVVLNVGSDDLRLRIQGSIDVVARASSTTRVLIPVNAQIGSGEVDLALQLRSPALVAVGDQQIIHVTVRADWERYGVIALGVIVGGLLVVGVIRTVLRRRRVRRSDAAEVPDGPHGEAL